MAEDYTPKIDLYLDGQLSQQETTDFEAAMETDANLKKEVQVHQLERRAVKELLKNRYKDKIKTLRVNSTISWEEETAEEKEIEQQLKQEAKVVTLRPMRRLLSIAASALALIMAGSAWWVNNEFSNDSLLAEGYYDAASAGNKSGEDTSNPLFQGGLQAYFVDKNYNQAVQQFEAIPTTDADYITAQYYLGHSHLQQKNYANAINHFETVLNAASVPAFVNKDEVTWNQLMAYLGNTDRRAAFQNKLVQLMETGRSPFKQKAINLNKQLNSFWRKFVF